MSRKLPVYILIDTSGSMYGEPIEAVNNGAKLLIRTLRKEGLAMETVKLSFIEFNSTASIKVPLTDLAQVQEPVFTAGGGTSLGQAFDVLGDSISKDVQVGNPEKEQKGDYKPLVFIFTDGYPTDDWKSALARFDKKKVNFIVSCGVPGADKNVLNEISGPEYVIELESANEDEIRKFFKWISQSVQFASKPAAASSDEAISPNSLPPMPNQEEELL